MHFLFMIVLLFEIKPLYTVRFHKGQFSGFSFVATAVPPSVAEECDQTSGVSSSHSQGNTLTCFISFCSRMC